MKETLDDIKSKLQSGDYRNEEHVRLSLVARVLQKLDWDIWNPMEVNSEFIVVPTEDKTRVDLALFLRPTLPSVFIEIKAVGQIQNRLHEIERQMRDYNRNNTALFSVITDGREWRFYYSQTAGEFSQKCFESFILEGDNIEDVERSLMTFLKKSEIANGNARREAETYLQLNQKQRTMEDCLPEARRLLHEAPFPSLPDALAGLVRDKGFTVSHEEAVEFIGSAVERRPPMAPAPRETASEVPAIGRRHPEVAKRVLNSDNPDN
ncbi:MAG: type I restriction endonuclease, partial [Verrucomicrobiia bacterium]